MTRFRTCCRLVLTVVVMSLWSSGQYGVRAFVRQTVRRQFGMPLAVQGFQFHRATTLLRASGDATTTSADVEKITAAIAQKGDEIRQLKADKAPKESILPAVDALLQLKKDFEQLTGKSFDPPKEEKAAPKASAPAPAPAKPAKVAKVAKDAPPVGLEDLREVRVGKMNTMIEAGVNPFAYTYKATHKSSELQVIAANLANGEEDEGSDVSVAGRIMLRRIFGKLAFFTLQDETGQIQLYLEKGRMGEAFETIKEWTDGSDIVGARGTLKRTDKGELSVYVKDWTMLTKSLLPLPDKFKGRWVGG